MSGRDLRAFLSGHRTGLHCTDNKDGLSHQLLTREVQPRHYKATDYSRLLATAKQHSSAASEGLKRVEELAKVGKRSRECGLLRHHKEAWRKKQAQLLDDGRRAQLDLESWRSAAVLVEEGGGGGGGGGWLKEFLAEVAEFEALLFEDREGFREMTVEPLWELRVDLKQLVQEAARPNPRCPTNQQDVLKELESVKQQQQRIWELLDAEFREVYSHLQPLVLSCCPRTEEAVIARGIPAELEEMDWPDSQLRETALREFYLLDNRFQATLELWKEKNAAVLDQPRGGWSEENAGRFALMKEQYPRDGSGRERTLLMDRAMRELPQKSRAEIVVHESWSTAVAHYHTQRRAYLKSWQQHRAELQDKVAAINGAAWEAHTMEEGVRRGREEQQRSCRELLEKVSKWREGKLEALRVESERAAREREKAEAQERMERESIAALRKKQHAKIEAYYSKLDVAKFEETERVQRLAREVERERGRQARSARGRVQQRQEGWGERLARLRAEEERAREEEELREKRLELLRKQVEVNVSTDPIRVLRDTKASSARGKSQTDMELELQSPLFPVHSFPADKLTSDPRFRVEAALRRAGLHATSYARRILAAIPPPQAPRPDQHSSLFKQD